MFLSTTIFYAVLSALLWGFIALRLLSALRAAAAAPPHTAQADKGLRRAA